MSVLLIVMLLTTGAPDPLRDFHGRVEAYVLLHRMLEAGTPPRVVTPDPEEIRLASDALASAIVAARPNARQGDIFTPAVARAFRDRIRSALAGASVDRYLRELYEGDDFKNLRAEVHARDPYCRVPLGIWTDLLWALPELPSELEYRVVGRDLALWDEHAALIVDFIPNAFPEESFTRRWPKERQLPSVLGKRGSRSTRQPRQ